MEKWLALIRVSLMGVLSGVNLTLPGKKRRSAGLAVLIFLAAFTLVMCATYSFALAETLAPLGALDLMVTLMLGMGWLFMFIFLMLGAQGIVFGGRDNDLVFSLPVSGFQVLMSRVAALYLEGLLIAVFSVIPMGAAYLWYGGPGGWGFGAILLVGALFLPLLPALLSLLAGFLISLAASRMARKGLAATLMSVLGMAALFLLLFNMDRLFGAMMHNLAALRALLSQALYPAHLLGRAAAEGDLGAFFQYIALSALPFALGVYLLSLRYKRLLNRLSSHALRRDYQLRQVPGGGPFRALMKKEVRRYFGSPIYLLNTGMGSIFLLGLSCYALFRGGFVLEIVSRLPLLRELFTPALTGIAALLVSMAGVSAVSISLEGRQLWILKSAPLSARRIFASKILMNLLVTLPALALSALLASLALKLSLAQLAQLIALPALVSLCSSCFGLCVNLLFPRLDAPNDTMVVKQSLSAMLGMFVPMLFVLGLALLYFFLARNHLSFEAYYALCCGLLASLALALGRWLATRGEALFQQLT